MESFRGSQLQHVILLNERVSGPAGTLLLTQPPCSAERGRQSPQECWGRLVRGLGGQESRLPWIASRVAQETPRHRLLQPGEQGVQKNAIPLGRGNDVLLTSRARVLGQPSCCSIVGERRVVSPPVPMPTGGLTPRRSPTPVQILHEEGSASLCSSSSQTPCLLTARNSARSTNTHCGSASTLRRTCP